MMCVCVCTAGEREVREVSGRVVEVHTTVHGMHGAGV